MELYFSSTQPFYSIMYSVTELHIRGKSSLESGFLIYYLFINPQIQRHAPTYETKWTQRIGVIAVIP